MSTTSLTNCRFKRLKQSCRACTGKHFTKIGKPGCAKINAESMIYLFIGQDEYSISKSLKRLKEELGAGDMLEANVAQVDADKLSPQELELQVTSMPFLAAKRMVIVRGLIDLFEKKEPKNKKSKSGSASSCSKEAEGFATAISNQPPTTVLVLIDKALSRANPLYK